MQGYDYIIIGAGSAGCVIANRLSEDPSCKVALIEAGPSDQGFPTNLKATLPIGNVFLLPHARYNWQYEFAESSSLNGRRIPCPRGKMLGGCSSVNGSVYIRGHQLDYDEWAQQGNTGWAYDDVLPYFKKQERRMGGDDAYHGRAGELDVVQPRAVNPLSQAFIESALTAGHFANEDFNGAVQDGFGVWDVNQRIGTRLSSSRAFLHPALRRKNLTVFTDCLVGKLDIAQGRVLGVTFTANGETKSLTAACEVIVTAGAINTPQLLMLSGIGPSASLEAQRIRVHADVPGVGENLQDHPSVPIAMSDQSATAYALTWSSLPKVLVSPFQYAFARRGMLASNAAECGGFIRTAPDLDRPDIQITLLAGLKQTARAIPREHGIMLLVSLLRPESRGRVSLRSDRPSDKPHIESGFIESRKDIETLMEGLRETRRILAQQPIAHLLGEEKMPGMQVQSDAELEGAIRSSLSTVYHPVGTCKMGTDQDPLAVVDTQLRVRGIKNLRVADASVMPTIIGGNTSAPTMMIGERVANFIRNDQRHILRSKEAHSPV